METQTRKIRIESMSGRPEPHKITIGGVTRTFITRKTTSKTPYVHEIETDSITTYYDIIKKLCEFKEYRPCGFWHPVKGNIYGSILDEPVTETEILLKEVSIYTPKNSFRVSENILAVYQAGLQDTINLYDCCLLNHGKIGEWIGFGRGPTTVPKIEDNSIYNLIFVVYGDTKPYVYNIHCFNKLIDVEADNILIPHLNQTFSLEKVEEPQLIHGLNVLRIRD